MLLEVESIVIEISQWIVSLPDNRVVIDWVRLPDGGYSILVDGRVYDLSVEVEECCCSVAGRCGRFDLRVRDPRRLDATRTVEQGQAGLQRICAEMPGKVIRVHVREGDAVACGQGLLVIEAMKMQNEIRAPKAGTIRAVGVTAGKTVSSGDFLLSLE
jgi:acetyl/propionyl-CoA carboxylase alpha subunit